MKAYNKAVAYVDGSFNSDTNIYGYGALLEIENGETLYLNGKGNDPRLISSINIAGEITAVWRISVLAYRLGIKELTIYYDYNGIEKWATGEWEARKAVSKFYKEIINNFSKGIKYNFIHVKSHSRNYKNDFVDFLAKKGCDIITDENITNFVKSENDKRINSFIKSQTEK